MYKLDICKFKAFSENFSIEFSENNTLLYGDNGTGKSSIYDALRVAFFYDKMESTLIDAATREEFNQQKNDLWSKYENKEINEKFSILINGVDYLEFDRNTFQVFMISMPELQIQKKINLFELLEACNIDFRDDNDFIENGYLIIQNEVNLRLEEFYENAEIFIDKEEGFDIKVSIRDKWKSNTSEIGFYFNEGKINIIVLLVIFCSIFLLAKKDSNIKKIIVLDDFITSLDVSNRSFIYRYFLKNFSKKFQIVILTHNISFFNYIKYFNNNISSHGTRDWNYINLYEIAGKHKLYHKGEADTATVIESNYNDSNNHPNDFLEQLGNRIRKRFEVLVTEFSKVLTLGGIDENRQILERLATGRSFYSKQGNKNVYDLIEEIENTLSKSNINDNYKIKRLSNQIKCYKVSLDDLKKTVNDLKLYQKTTMHPLSHGTEGIPTFTNKEILASIHLLKKLERTIEGIVDSNIISA